MNGELANTEAGSLAASPKPLSSWAQAVINNGPMNQNQVPGLTSSNSCIMNSGSHCDNSTEKKGEPEKELPKSSPAIIAATLSDNWGNAVSRGFDS